MSKKYIDGIIDKNMNPTTLSRDEFYKVKFEFEDRLSKYFDSGDEPDGSMTWIELKNEYSNRNYSWEFNHYVKRLESYINTGAPYLDFYKRGNGLLDEIIKEITEFE